MPVWIDMPDGVRQRLVADWHWLGVRIPQGFVSDGASVPWFARWLIERRGRYVFAAYVHDYLLGVTTRNRAAKKFLYGMKKLDVPRWKRVLMHQAVSLVDRFKE